MLLALNVCCKIACRLRETVVQAQGILLEFQAAALASEALTDLQRAHICMALALADKALCDGADEQLQLLAALASCQKALKS